MDCLQREIQCPFNWIASNWMVEKLDDFDMSQIIANEFEKVWCVQLSSNFFLFNFLISIVLMTPRNLFYVYF